MYMMYPLWDVHTPGDRHPQDGGEKDHHPLGVGAVGIGTSITDLFLKRECEDGRHH